MGGSTGLLPCEVQGAALVCYLCEVQGAALVCYLCGVQRAALVCYLCGVQGGSTGLLPVWGAGGSTGLLPVWGAGGSTGLFCRDDPNPVPLLKSDMESFAPYWADVVRTAAALKATLLLLPRWLCCNVIILCVLGCVMTFDDCNNSWLLCGLLLWLPLLLLLKLNAMMVVDYISSWIYLHWTNGVFTLSDKETDTMTDKNGSVSVSVSVSGSVNAP